ncbi:MAG: hypothetical protein GQ475_01020 [Methylococcaceae bacterium]|nr:hypothetical protein [Methylococcaceae bacterium]
MKKNPAEKLVKLIMHGYLSIRMCQFRMLYSLVFILLSIVTTAVVGFNSTAYTAYMVKENANVLSLLCGELALLAKTGGSMAIS